MKMVSHDTPTPNPASNGQMAGESAVVLSRQIEDE
jgi:hypothetical protein